MAGGLGQCHNQWVQTATDIAALVAMVALMVLVVVFAWWHFRQIRAGRMDPLVGPESSRPPSPPSGMRWGTDAPPGDLEGDRYVGRPFPPSEANA